MSNTPYFRSSTVISEFEALHLSAPVSLTEAHTCNRSNLGVASPGPAALARSTENRPHKQLSRRVTIKFTTSFAVSSLFKLRRTRRSKNPSRRDTVSYNSEPATTMNSNPVRDGSNFTPPAQLRSPAITLVSLDEAAKRPDLTKELYLGDNTTCTLSSSLLSALPECRQPQPDLISLNEAAARPELTKRVLFM